MACDWLKRLRLANHTEGSPERANHLSEKESREKKKCLEQKLESRELSLLLSTRSPPPPPFFGEGSSLGDLSHPH